MPPLTPGVSIKSRKIVKYLWNRFSDPPGFNLPLILNTLSGRVEDLLAADRASDNLGGRSIVALLVPSALSYVNEQDYGYCQRYMERLSWRLPNLHFIYYGGGALVRFHDFVHEPSRDLFLLDTEKPPEICGNPVITRIRQGKSAGLCSGSAVAYKVLL